MARLTIGKRFKNSIETQVGEVRKWIMDAINCDGLASPMTAEEKGGEREWWETFGSFFFWKSLVRTGTSRRRRRRSRWRQSKRSSHGHGTAPCTVSHQKRREKRISYHLRILDEWQFFLFFFFSFTSLFRWNKLIITLGNLPCYTYSILYLPKYGSNVMIKPWYV